MRTLPRLALHALVGATAAAMAATLALAPPAQATTPAAATSPEQNSASIEEAVELLEPYVYRSEQDGTFVLDAPAVLIKEIGSDTHQAILEGMGFVNGMIRSGELVSTSDLRAVPRSSADPGNITPYSHGVNSWDCGWVSCTVALNGPNTTRALELIAVGAAGSAFAAFLCGIFGGSCTNYAGAAAAFLALGYAVINFCANSHGVWVRYGLGSWCGGQ